VQNLKLIGCTINTDANSTNDVLTGLTASYVSQATNLPDPWQDQYRPHTTGIILNGANNLIANSVIAFSSGDGVFLGGSNNTVQNCIIHDVDIDGADEAGVTSLGTGNQVLQNTIYNASRSGVVIRYAPQNTIMHNRIYNCGLQTTDLGGVYADMTDGMQTRIAYNVISDIRTSGYGAVGIYIDNSSSNYIIDHNVTWNVDDAVKLNPPESGNLLYDNTLIGVTDSLFATSADAMDGNAVINNLFIGEADIGSDAQSSNNLSQPALTIFVNAARNNYRLRKKSPDIDAGTAVAGYTDGYKGAAPDIGAYEFGVKPFVAGSTLKVRKG
jgi:hypothetical protein